MSESPSRGPRVAGIVLAAGASRRLGVPKQLLPDESGRALVARTVMQLRQAGCAPVLVITGAGHEEVSRSLDAVDATVVFNASWAEGMGSSIRCAMEWLDTHAAIAATDGAIIAACDMPSVTTAHLEALMSTWVAGRSRVASSYNTPSGARVLGVPALFPTEDWGALRELAGDRGARDLLALPGTASVLLYGGSFDLDTPEDVERWRAGLR